jgi:hypothetical protein
MILVCIHMGAAYCLALSSNNCSLKERKNTARHMNAIVTDGGGGGAHIIAEYMYWRSKIVE